MAEVARVCGTPDYQDHWNAPLPIGRGFGNATDVWYYDSGPSQLLRMLTFLNGTLNTIDTDGYGFPADMDAGCEPQQIAPGMSKYRLWRLCGSPAAQQAQSLLQAQPTPSPAMPNPSARFQRPVYLEYWYYEFGPQRLSRWVTLEDDRVRDIDAEPPTGGLP